MRYYSYFLSIFRKNKIRYLACVIGFGVALGAVFGVSAYSSLLDETVNRFYFLDDNSVMLLSKGTNVMQIIPFESQIPENVSDTLTDIAGVVYTLPVIFKDFSNSSQFKWLKNVIVGINTEQLQNFFLQGLDLAQGRWAEPNSYEVVVGPNLELENWGLGTQIPIRGVNFTITGILQPYNVFFDKFLYIDYGITQDHFDMEGLCSAMYVIGDPDLFDNPNYVNTIEQEIEEQYPSINLIDQEELDEASGLYYRVLDIFNAVLGLFPLFISGLFIFILMLLNVKDQEREFGMLRALGTPLRFIAFTVFLQSVAITLIGYIISILTGYLYFGYGFYLFKDSVSSQNVFAYTRDMMAQIPVKVYLNSLLISFLIGALIAVYPSIRAIKTSIVYSFRKEE